MNEFITILMILVFIVVVAYIMGQIFPVNYHQTVEDRYNKTKGDN